MRRPLDVVHGNGPAFEAGSGGVRCSLRCSRNRLRRRRALDEAFRGRRRPDPGVAHGPRLVGCARRNVLLDGCAGDPCPHHRTRLRAAVFRTRDESASDGLPDLPSWTGEHTFVSIKGGSYARFRRALDRGNLTLVPAAAAELPTVNLDDAWAFTPLRLNMGPSPGPRRDM